MLSFAPAGGTLHMSLLDNCSCSGAIYNFDNPSQTPLDFEISDTMWLQGERSCIWPCHFGVQGHVSTGVENTGTRYCAQAKNSRFRRAFSPISIKALQCSDNLWRRRVQCPYSKCFGAFVFRLRIVSKRLIKKHVSECNRAALILIRATRYSKKMKRIYFVYNFLEFQRRQLMTISNGSHAVSWKFIDIGFGRRHSFIEVSMACLRGVLRMFRSRAPLPGVWFPRLYSARLWWNCAINNESAMDSILPRCIFMDESHDEVCYGRDAKRRVYNELDIWRVHEYFHHATQQCIKRFWHFFSRVHSTGPPFRTVKCRGHWTDHNHFQGSTTRFDYGQFQNNTCSYVSWAFSCMIIVLSGVQQCVCSATH